MATVLVVGTLAVDYIGRYESSFENLSKSEALNLSLSLSDLKQSFGGCAMNIAVGLQKLGHRALPFALVGRELNAEYEKHLKQLGMCQDGLISIPDYQVSSTCFIVTDKDGNQFTTFYPGPSRSERYSELLTGLVSDNSAEIDCAIIAPDVGANMLTAISLCQEYDIPFLTDPGQCLNDFSLVQTQEVAAQSSVLVLNQHEFALLNERVNDTDSLPLVFRTLGNEGVALRRSGQEVVISAVKPERQIDPTGCGDAFRVGLIHGRIQGHTWRQTCEIATTLASIAIESHGTQNYSVAGLPQRLKYHWDLEIQNNPLNKKALY